MKIKRIVSLFLVLVLALSAVAVLGSCKKEEKKTDNITVQIGPNPETLDPALNSAVDGGGVYANGNFTVSGACREFEL